jgi:hypothetical protein
MPVAHTYRLGKDQSLTFANGGTTFVANKDIKDATITRETAAEAEVTTRGSEGIQEFVPVRWNATLEVVCFDHACPIHATGTVTIVTAGPSGTSTATGLYYANNIGEPQMVDGAIEYTISLKRFAGLQVS